MVSVDVKHHVYLLMMKMTYQRSPPIAPPQRPVTDLSVDRRLMKTNVNRWSPDGPLVLKGLPAAVAGSGEWRDD